MIADDSTDKLRECDSDKGGRGSKNPTFLQTSYVHAPLPELRLFPPTAICRQLRKWKPLRFKREKKKMNDGCCWGLEDGERTNALSVLVANPIPECRLQSRTTDYRLVHVHIFTP